MIRGEEGGGGERGSEARVGPGGGGEKFGFFDGGVVIVGPSHGEDGGGEETHVIEYLGCFLADAKDLGTVEETYS